MSNDPAKYEELIKQYLRSILVESDIRGLRGRLDSCLICIKWDLVCFPLANFTFGFHTVSSKKLRWLKTVSSTFQDLEFDGSL